MTQQFVHVYRETRELRNKRIALEAIGLLQRCAYILDDPVISNELDLFRQRWEARGVTWLRPADTPFNPDAWLPAPEIAKLADVTPNAVRNWYTRGHITSTDGPNGRPLFNVGEVVRYQARRTKSAK